MKIRVQMPRGTGSVSVAGQSYQADDDGIVKLDSPAHVAPLVSLGGVELSDDGEPGLSSTLVTPTNFPESVQIREGDDPMALTDITLKTKEKIGLGVDDWNNLPSRARDTFVGWFISTERGELGDVSATKRALDDATAEVERLRNELEDANTQIGHLQRQQPSIDETSQPPVGEDRQQSGASMPIFAEMTKARINEWLVSTDAPEATGNHDAHVTVAEARWAELNKQA